MRSSQTSFKYSIMGYLGFTGNCFSYFHISVWYGFLRNCVSFLSATLMAGSFWFLGWVILMLRFGKNQRRREASNLFSLSLVVLGLVKLGFARIFPHFSIFFLISGRFWIVDMKQLVNGFWCRFPRFLTDIFLISKESLFRIFLKIFSQN